MNCKRSKLWAMKYYDLKSVSMFHFRKISFTLNDSWEYRQMRKPAILTMPRRVKRQVHNKFLALHFNNLMQIFLYSWSSLRSEEYNLATLIPYYAKLYIMIICISVQSSIATFNKIAKCQEILKYTFRRNLMQNKK